jgi:hypothetical protein
LEQEIPDEGKRRYIIQKNTGQFPFGGKNEQLRRGVGNRSGKEKNQIQDEGFNKIFQRILLLTCPV